ncbi:MAG: pyridoxal phosphate-dependent aminotransferase family protein [Desulfomonile tiedjei]|uniref:Pyridoxal phosphate-dependent aminotransferase family protein n=1 Tax=Desulfomonile tiedjei TaxID=2358 RepID=A0A9D6V8S2_9BACT|nr:pyridoxal phosphate-dependent aminotransferase family protein [Desulfomonile tiedjei]
MPDLFDKCYSFTRDQEAIAAGFYPFFKAISRLDGPHVTVDGRDLIMVGSNNYLGLTTHPKVREAAMQALKEYGTSCSGSRFANGTIDLHEKLEAHLAKFVGKQAAQVFSTGFQTNQGVIAPLLSRSDTVIIDRLVHASIVDGVRLSFGKVRRFRHNDTESLRRNLEASADSSGVLVIVDGVYSMEGDIAPLPEIIATSKEFGARIMVDDAHGLGVLGENGRGTLEHFGVVDDVDLVMGTFSKSLASLGGFIAGDERVISFIKHHSRALIFSASMPPSAIATVQAALEVIETEPEIRQNLWRNTVFFREQLLAAGFNTGPTETPIVPVIVGDDFRTLVLWKRLFEEGLFTNCVLAPGVPEGSQRIRMCLMATHTMEDLEKVVEICTRVGKEIGII